MVRDFDREDREFALMQELALVRTLDGGEPWRWFAERVDDSVADLQFRMSSRRLDHSEYAELVGRVAGLRAAVGIPAGARSRIEQEMNRLRMGGPPRGA